MARQKEPTRTENPLYTVWPLQIIPPGAHNWHRRWSWQYPRFSTLSKGAKGSGGKPKQPSFGPVITTNVRPIYTGTQPQSMNKVECHHWMFWRAWLLQDWHLWDWRDF